MIYCKIPLIRPARLYGQKTNFTSLHSGREWGFYTGGAYIREEKHFNFQSAKLHFLSFFQYKSCIIAFFTSCKMWNMLKVDNKDTRIRKVNNKVKNKDTIEVVLATFLLTMSTFHISHCFYCWLWSANYWLGLLFIVLALCTCWNQFRQSFYL